MKQNDIIMVNVTGTNGTTRHQKNISRSFNGAGLRIDDNGKIDNTSGEVLRNLPGGTGEAAPQFPAAEFAAAQALTGSPDPVQRSQGVEKIKAIQIAYAQLIAQWEKSQGGGNEKVVLARSVLEYTKEFHGFRETDGDHFVMKLENLDVTTIALNDGRTMYQVAGTAVFG